MACEFRFRRKALELTDRFAGGGAGVAKGIRSRVDRGRRGGTWLDVYIAIAPTAWLSEKIAGTVQAHQTICRGAGPYVLG